MLIVCHYLAPRFAAFVARIAGEASAAVSSHAARPVKSFVRMKAKMLDE